MTDDVTGEDEVATGSVRATKTMRLPFSPASVSVVRQRLNGFMSEVGGSRESIEDARLVVSELVTNSVRHARPLPDGSLVVAWTLEDDGVRLSVTDGGSGTHPRNMTVSTSALAGRGISIVNALARAWWTERGESRSTVHALLDV